MGRQYARIRLSIWEDEKYLELTPDAQHLYYVLTTDPELSYCGRADWRPARLTSRARGWKQDRIIIAAAELEQERFVLFSPETEEALVRSLIRSDELLRNPKMALSVVKAYSAVASRTLRAAVVTELRRDKSEHPDYPSWSSPMSKEHLARLLILPDLESVGYANRIGNSESVGIANPIRSVLPIVTPVDITNADRSVSYQQTADSRQQTFIQQPNGGFGSTEGHQRAEHEPPPGNCSNHPGGTLTKCGPCGDARKALEIWERAEAASRAKAKSDRARQQAEDRARAIADCAMCDDDGQYGMSVCSHDPGDVERNREGSAKVRAALAERKSADA